MSKDLEKGLRKLLGDITPKMVNNALTQAGFLLMRDCVIEFPRVPLHEGTLRGSGSVFVGKKLTSTSADLGYQPGKHPPATSHSEHVSGGPYAVVGWNTPYAARLHEHPEYKFREPGTGGKYMERAMAKNHMAYGKAMARVLQAELQRGTA